MYLLKTKIVSYNELALTKTSGVSFYYYNKFFESAGSSLSNLVKNWVLLHHEPRYF